MCSVGLKVCAPEVADGIGHRPALVHVVGHRPGISRAPPGSLAHRPKCVPKTSKQTTTTATTITAAATTTATTSATTTRSDLGSSKLFFGHWPTIQ